MVSLEGPSVNLDSNRSLGGSELQTELQSDLEEVDDPVRDVFVDVVVLSLLLY